jgi:hypothetical protein
MEGVSRKGDSKIQIRDRKDLLHVLTDRDTFTRILQQADDTLKSTEYLREIADGQDSNFIADYFMRINDKVNPEELQYYWIKCLWNDFEIYVPIRVPE